MSSPVRSCVACRLRKSKKDLIRVASISGDLVSVDLKAKVQSRGAYICSDLDCLMRARRIKALDRALKCRIPVEIYDELEALINGKTGQNTFDAGHSHEGR